MALEQTTLVKPNSLGHPFWFWTACSGGTWNKTVLVLLVVCRLLNKCLIMSSGETYWSLNVVRNYNWCMLVYGFVEIGQSAFFSSLL
jgi:hypothetical protein